MTSVYLKIQSNHKHQCFVPFQSVDSCGKKRAVDKMSKGQKTVFLGSERYWEKLHSCLLIVTSRHSASFELFHCVVLVFGHFIR